MIDPEAPILIAADPSFRSGVVGLVASRLVEKTYRPAIIVEKGESESRGSCRSIPEFHITKALDELSDLLVRHGGHAQAAGFTIRNENVETFFRRMTELARSELSGQDLRPSLAVDAQLGLDSIDWALQETLAQLEPTGYHNPAPLFMSAGVEVLSHRAVGRDSAHLQLFLTDSRRIALSQNGGGPQAVPAIAFRQGDWAAAMPSRIDVVYTLNVNQWQGRSNLQLMIQDLRPAAAEESPS
jgi:single-stranded-DNA-specific exonuclease